MSQKDNYIPALNQTWLTPLYDPVLKWVMQEDGFKRRLVQQMRLEPGMRVLDLGCGTGTLTIQIKQTEPGVEVTGIDGDPQILEIATAKAERAGVSIVFDQGLAFQLPYPDDTFDRVVSSLVYHHLTAVNKQLTAAEIFRVLKLGGELHVADFGKPHNSLAQGLSLISQHFEQMADNVQGALPGMFQRAGLEAVQVNAQFMTILGTLSLYEARKPENAASQG